MSPMIAEDENSMLRMEEGEMMPRIKGAQSVQVSREKCTNHPWNRHFYNKSIK